MKKIITLFLVLSTFYFAQAAFFIQDREQNDNEEKIPYRVPKVNSEIKIDAFLNEDAWKQAVKIDANIEVRPGENIPAPVKTEVLIAYDDLNVYVAFKAFDPDPSKIQAHLCDRDNIWDDDWVIILFDTFNDQRRTYDFGCNPLVILLKVKRNLISYPHFLLRSILVSFYQIFVNWEQIFLTY